MSKNACWCILKILSLTIPVHAFPEDFPQHIFLQHIFQQGGLWRPYAPIPLPKTAHDNSINFSVIYLQVLCLQTFLIISAYMLNKV